MHVFVRGPAAPQANCCSADCVLLSRSSVQEIHEGKDRKSKIGKHAGLYGFGEKREMGAALCSKRVLDCCLCLKARESLFQLDHGADLLELLDQGLGFVLLHVLL